MAVGARQSHFGCALVHRPCLQDEANFVERGVDGEIIDGILIELHVVGGGGRGVGDEFEELFAVMLHQHKLSVGARNHSVGRVPVGFHGYIYIEVARWILEMPHVYSFFIDIFLALFKRIGIHVAKHLEAIFRLAHNRTERNGNRQANHAGAGDAHAHGILYHVAAEKNVDALRKSAKGFAGTCHTQRHCGRLRASDCRHHFALDQSYNPIDCFSIHFDSDDIMIQG